MNKSTLFLLSLFSIINFSCSAMEIIQRGAYQFTKATTDLFNRISQQEPTFKTFEQQYRKNIEDFNTNADELKKNVADNTTRLKIVDNLKGIQNGISFVKRVINTENKTLNQESLRVKSLEVGINEFDNIQKHIDRDRITALQQVLTKMANITINENNNMSFHDSGIFCANNIIDEKDIKIFENEPLWQLYESISKEKKETQQQLQEIKNVKETTQKFNISDQEPVKTLQDFITQMENRIINNEEVWSWAKQYIDGLSKKLDDANNSIASTYNNLQKTKDTFDKVIETLKADKKNLQSQLEQVNKNNSTNLIEQKKAHNGQITKLTEEITILKDSIQTLETLNQKLDGQATIDQETLDELRQDLLKLNLEITSLTLEKQRLETQLLAARQANTKNCEEYRKSLQDNLALEHKLASVYFRLKVCTGIAVIIATYLAYYFNLHTKGIELLSQLNPSLS